MRSISIVVVIFALLASAQHAHAVGIPAGTRLDIVADATYINAASQVQNALPSVVSLTVLRLAGALIEREPFFGRTVPGDDVYVPLRIRNAGNAEDLFTLTAVSTHGWITDFVYDDNADGIHQESECTTFTDTGLMFADGYSPCFLRVRVPVDATEEDTIVVRAISTADPIRGIAQTQIKLAAPGALVVNITSPTSDPIYAASSDTLTIQGIADSGAAVTQVTWKNSRGGSGTCTGTACWYAANVHVYTGANIITITATDSAQRTATDVLTVNVADTTAPAIAIAGPTDASSYVTTSRIVTVTGTASDSHAISSVSWTNDRGGSGDCEGTTTWSTGSIILAEGNNLITVTARNSSDKTKSDTLNVNYTLETTGPAIAVTTPSSSPAYSTTSSVISLAGVATSDEGIASVTWSNSRGGSGDCTGTISWTVPEIALQIGQNVITASATDLSGTTVTDTITITRIQLQSPAITITSPTSADSWVSGRQTITLSGTASAAMGITHVTWSSDRGSSGDCEGIGSWSAADIPLESGENVIMVSASDDSQILGTDQILVTYQEDTAQPTIEITSPTDQSRCARNCPVLNLRGMVWDDTSVAAVWWENDATGESGSGALNDDIWSVGGIALVEGENSIMVTAEDGVGNTASVGIVVTYIDTLPGDAWLGRAMVSVPIIPDETDPKEAAGFYANAWCCFRTSANQYAMYPSRFTWFEPASQTPGRGFWAVFAETPDGPYGTIPSQNAPAVIALKTGWNLVGNPFISDVRWDVTQILAQEPGKSPKPLNESADLTPGYAWGWRQNPDNPYTGDYYLVSDSNISPGVDDKLEPWRGYWIKALKDCYLILPPPE